MSVIVIGDLSSGSTVFNKSWCLHGSQTMDKLHPELTSLVIMVGFNDEHIYQTNRLKSRE